MEIATNSLKVARGVDRKKFVIGWCSNETFIVSPLCRGKLCKHAWCGNLRRSLAACDSQSKSECDDELNKARLPKSLLMCRLEDANRNFHHFTLNCVYYNPSCFNLGFVRRWRRELIENFWNFIGDWTLSISFTSFLIYDITHKIHRA